MVHGVFHQLAHGRDTQFFAYVAAVGFDCARANVKPFGYFFTRQTDYSSKRLRI